MPHFPFANAYLIAFRFTKRRAIEMALPSSYQGHIVLNIAQSINALKPKRIHIKYVSLSGLAFFFFIMFNIQGRRLHQAWVRGCQSLDSPVVNLEKQKK